MNQSNNPSSSQGEPQPNLQALIDERTAELMMVISRLEQAQEDLRLQARAIQQLSTPVVQIWDGILLVPLVGSIDDRRAQQLIETLLVTISERSAETVIIDITGVSTVDTAVANYLIRTVKAARLLGAHPMLVGISAEVAQTLVTLGVDLREIETSADLQRGLQRAFEAIGLQLGNR